MNYPIPLSAALTQGAEYYPNYAAFQASNPNEASDFVDAPIKRWRIPGLPPTQQFTFKYAEPNTEIKSMTMTGKEAGMLNLPGARKPYPKYETWLAARPKSQSMVKFTFFASQFERPVETDDNTTILFSPAEAKAFLTLLPSGWGMEEAPPPAPTAVFNWKDERRVWNVLAPDGQKYSLGHIFRDISTRGVGAPGKFVTLGKDEVSPASLGGEPLVWIPLVANTGEAETRSIPLPLRDLLPGERIHITALALLEIVMEGSPLDGGTTGANSEVLVVAKETLKRVTQMQLKIDRAMPG